WHEHSPMHRDSLLLLLLGSALVLSACDDELPTRRPVATQRVAEAPAQPVTAPSASELRELDAPGLFEYMRGRGKRGTVVNVWASWCGSCREEIPLLLQMQKTMAAEGIDFLFVTADETRDFAKAVELMRSWSGPLPVLAVAGAMTPFKLAMHPSWKGAIPATFLFDAEQKRRHFWEGPVLEHEITPILQGYLAGEPIDGETRPRVSGPRE
ncbi:MAG TPA: TlpA disulfide reductase family protein, partial [Polyangiales bacterium]|nr:TlpA disulfide reductase family protein [Polyangiales bacterium]